MEDFSIENSTPQFFAIKKSLPPNPDDSDQEDHPITYNSSDNSYKLSGDDYELSVFSVMSSLVKKAHLNKDVTHYEWTESRLVKPLEYLPKDSEESFVVQYETLHDQTRISFYRIKNEISELTLKEFIELDNVPKIPNSSKEFSKEDVQKVSIEAMRILHFNKFPDIWGNHLSKLSSKYLLRTEKGQRGQEPIETLQNHFQNMLIMPINQEVGYDNNAETWLTPQTQPFLSSKGQSNTIEVEENTPSYLISGLQRQNGSIGSLYTPTKSDSSSNTSNLFRELREERLTFNKWRPHAFNNNTLAASNSSTEKNNSAKTISMEESDEIFNYLRKRPKFDVDFEEDFEPLLGRKKVHILPAI